MDRQEHLETLKEQRKKLKKQRALISELNSSAIHLSRFFALLSSLSEDLDDEIFTEIKEVSNEIKHLTPDD